ncbi:phosphotransferase [Bacillus subtilis subsp. subtilis]|nr:phosphotransferase [Bacillus subtilis subsp. subtilis]
MTHTPHLVQGLANDAVAADWPAIDAREIAWLRDRYPQLGPDSRVAWHSPRPLSAAAIVESAHGRVFVKRHHGSVRNAATLGEEHRFIAHLDAAGVPVVQVLRSGSGATALEHAGWTYELHRVGQGQDLYRDAPSWTPLADLARAHAAGRMLATLHRASASYHAGQRTTHLLVARDDLIRAADPLAMIAADLGRRPGLAAYLARQRWQDDLQRAVLPWHAALGGRLQAEPRLWAHNDWHVSNLLWHRGSTPPQVQTVFDFGLASPTSAMFDLATAIERNAIAWLALEQQTDAARAAIAQALLAGYREVVPLPAERVHLLADLLPVVHLDFALSEVEYFQGITGSPANADVAYHTFLLGHADWFSRVQGQRLLDALHAAA